MATPDRLPPAIRKYFEVEAFGTHWDLRCKVCGDGWRLRDSGAGVAIGNSLHLLDHAYSHVEIKKRVPLLPSISDAEGRAIVELNEAARVSEVRANIASIRARAVARG